VREVWRHNRFHAALMVYTAVMVPATDFLIGVLSALIIYAVLFKFLDRPSNPSERSSEFSTAAPKRDRTHSRESVSAARE
jgi:sulfate permease, SulP family